MWAQGRAGTPNSCPQSDQAPRLRGSEEGWGATDDGSDPSAQCRKWGPSPRLLPLPPFLPLSLSLVAPRAPDVHSHVAGSGSLPSSLQHCVLHRGKDHLSRSLQPVCTCEPGSKKEPRNLPASFPSCLRLASAPGYPEPLLDHRPASDWSDWSILPLCPSPSSCGVSGLGSFLSLPTWSHNSLGQQAFRAVGKGGWSAPYSPPFLLSCFNILSKVFPEECDPHS